MPGYRLLTKIKELLLFFIPNKNMQHAVGLHTWPTKNYEIWVILQDLLYLIKPQELVEFGAGRSTNYLAEYAYKFQAKLVSIEQHFFYFVKLRIGFKCLFLPVRVIKYAPLRGCWYDVKRVKKYLEPLRNIDFLFYDGPTGTSKGDRNSEDFYIHVIPLLKNIKMIVVDDVHRDKENKIAQHLTRELKLKRYNVTYIHNAQVAFLFSPAAEEKAAELPIYLKKLLVPAESSG